MVTFSALYKCLHDMFNGGALGERLNWAAGIWHPEAVTLGLHFRPG